MARSFLKSRPLTVAGYLSLTWWGLALLSLAGATTAGVLTPWIAVTSVILSLWTLLPLTERLLVLRARFPILLIFGIAAVVQGARIFSVDHDVLLMTADGLAGVLPIALQRRRKAGLGYWSSFLTTFLLSLAGVVSEGELNTYTLFILFLAVGAANLNAAHLFTLTGPSQARIQTLSIRYFRQFIASALTGFAFGAFIFLAFPREYSWANPWGMRQKNSTLGYTNSITLDGSSVNGDSSALAFTIESSEPRWLAILAKDLYLRGNTVDRFDGIHWTASGSNLQIYRPNHDVRLTKSHALGITRLKFYREASSTPNLFYPQVLRSISLSPRFGSVNVDQNGNVSRNRTEAFPFVYEVSISNPLPPKESLTINEMISAGEKAIKRDGPSDLPYELTPHQQKVLLDVPENIAHAEYFKEWMKQIPFDPDVDTAFTLTNSIRRDFQKHFKATLIHDMPANTAFETFLSKVKKGHCEYFSTAAVLYLRSHKIASRVVLGYLGGVFNPISNVAEVRESAAHAWVEYFSPGQGWFLFDPTPLVPNLGGSRWMEQVQAYYSAARFWFNRYVADYNSRTQVALIKSLVIHNPDRKTASSKNQGWLILLSTVLVAGILGGFLVSRRNWRAGPDVPDYYRFFLRRMQKAGFRRRENESYQAFHQRIIAAGIDRGFIDDVNKVVEIDLYSNLRTSAGLRRRIKRAIRKAPVRG